MKYSSLLIKKIIIILTNPVTEIKVTFKFSLMVVEQKFHIIIHLTT